MEREPKRWENKELKQREKQAGKKEKKPDPTDDYISSISGSAHNKYTVNTCWLDGYKNEQKDRWMKTGTN